MLTHAPSKIGYQHTGPYRWFAVTPSNVWTSSSKQLPFHRTTPFIRAERISRFRMRMNITHNALLLKVVFRLNSLQDTFISSGSHIRIISKVQMEKVNITGSIANVKPSPFSYWESSVEPFSVANQLLIYCRSWAMCKWNPFVWQKICTVFSSIYLYWAGICAFNVFRQKNSNAWFLDSCVGHL